MTVTALTPIIPIHSNRQLELDVWALEAHLQTLMRDHATEDLGDMLATMNVDAVLQEFLETIYPGEE